MSSSEENLELARRDGVPVIVATADVLQGAVEGTKRTWKDLMARPWQRRHEEEAVSLVALSEKEGQGSTCLEPPSSSFFHETFGGVRALGCIDADLRSLSNTRWKAHDEIHQIETLLHIFK